MPTDKQKDEAYAKGQRDGGRERNIDFMESLLEAAQMGPKHYHPPSNEDLKDVYDDGWKNAGKNPPK